jgi:hypothetical protein
MAIAAESLTSPGLQSAGLTIAAESSASSRLQLAAYPMTIAVATALEKSSTITAIVASTAVADDAVGGEETMSKQVAVSVLCPSCHILGCWMDA